MKKLLLILAFVQSGLMVAQSQQDDLAFNLSASALPVLNDYRLGAETSLRYYLTNEFSIGGKFQYTFNNYHHGFMYNTPRTIVHYLNISMPLQFDVVNKERFQLGLGFAPGISLATLRDKTQAKEEEYYDDETGITTVVSTPVRLNRDAYFTLMPNVDVAVKLFDIEKESNTAFYITGNAGYQLTLGKGDFTKPTDFRNYIVSLGFTIKGSSK